MNVHASIVLIAFAIFLFFGVKEWTDWWHKKDQKGQESAKHRQFLDTWIEYHTEEHRKIRQLLTETHDPDVTVRSPEETQPVITDAQSRIFELRLQALETGKPSALEDLVEEAITVLRDARNAPWDDMSERRQHIDQATALLRYGLMLARHRAETTLK